MSKVDGPPDAIPRPTEPFSPTRVSNTLFTYAELRSFGSVLKNPLNTDNDSSDKEMIRKSQSREAPYALTFKAK